MSSVGGYSSLMKYINYLLCCSPGKHEVQVIDAPQTELHVKSLLFANCPALNHKDQEAQHSHFLVTQETAAIKTFF